MSALAISLKTRLEATCKTISGPNHKRLGAPSIAALRDGWECRNFPRESLSLPVLPSKSTSSRPEAAHFAAGAERPLYFAFALACSPKPNHKRLGAHPSQHFAMGGM
jgi:hypothetical protein